MSKFVILLLLAFLNLSALASKDGSNPDQIILSAKARCSFLLQTMHNNRREALENGVLVYDAISQKLDVQMTPKGTGMFKSIGNAFPKQEVSFDQVIGTDIPGAHQIRIGLINGRLIALSNIGINVALDKGLKINSKERGIWAVTFTRGDQEDFLNGKAAEFTLEPIVIKNNRKKSKAVDQPEEILGISGNTSMDQSAQQFKAMLSLVLPAEIIGDIEIQSKPSRGKVRYRVKRDSDLIEVRPFVRYIDYIIPLKVDSVDFQEEE
ncbi:MAG: hypothetical protein AB7F43_12640 [Bacteriovoracia bacterium]